MELVQAFNAELSTLYEVKPPISKAKISSITKTAIKAIKLYKHVVQSVERFIAKCRPEYKIPGLYVIDSIVRQSRHQFGPDKDVFGPRFIRNFNQTFQNLFLSCPTDDKPKIVRVLNLWQKNNVFTTDVIQPLLDMANPNADLAQLIKSPILIESSNKIDINSDNFVLHLQKLASSLGLSKNTNCAEQNQNDNQIRFNKKLLDFDYGDDDDEDKGQTPTESELLMSSSIKNSNDMNANPLALSMAQNLLSNPDLFQKLQESIVMQTDPLKNDNTDLSSSVSSFLMSSSIQKNDLTEQLNSLRDSLKLVNKNFQKDYLNLNYETMQSSQRRISYNDLDAKSKSSPSRKYLSNWHKDSSTKSGRDDEKNSYKNDKSKNERRDRDRDRDRDKSDRERNNRDKKNYRSRSKSPRFSPDKDIKEKERERRKKSLPALRNNFVTICSTTLWIGHLPKSATEINISDAFGEYGTINTIDLISARGCAYVCMNRRQDAYKALQNLKSLKLNGSHLKMAWAPGKGMKGREFKDFWDVELGCSYIPYDKLNESVDFELLEDGGMIDDESLPNFLKEIRDKKISESKNEKEDLQNQNNPNTFIIPNIVSMPSITSIPSISSIPNPFALGIPPGMVVPPLPPLPVGVPPPPLLGPMPPSILQPSASSLINSTNTSIIPPPPPPQIQSSLKDNLQNNKETSQINNKNIQNKNDNPSVNFPIPLNVPPLPNVTASNSGPLPWIPGSLPLLPSMPPLQPPFLKNDAHNFISHNNEETFNSNIFDQIDRKNLIGNTHRNQFIQPFEDERDLPYDSRCRYNVNNNLNRSNNYEENNRSLNSSNNSISYNRDNSWRRRDQRREDRGSRYYNDNSGNLDDNSRTKFNENRNHKRKRENDSYKSNWNNNNSYNRNRRRDYNNYSNNTYNNQKTNSEYDNNENPSKSLNDSNNSSLLNNLSNQELNNQDLEEDQALNSIQKESKNLSPFNQSADKDNFEKKSKQSFSEEIRENKQINMDIE